MSALWEFDVDTDPALVSDAATQSTTASAQATIAAAKRWQSRLFTTSGTWVVPADVGCIWLDGSGCGGGGGGGNATPGGGGGGGGPGMAIKSVMLATTPGETIVITLGVGGTGGGPGVDGTTGGLSSLVATSGTLYLEGGALGSKGLSPNGGTAGGTSGNGITALGGAVVGGEGKVITPYMINGSLIYQSSEGVSSLYTTGSAGGALNFAGGYLLTNTGCTAANGGLIGGAAGSAAGGGGGHGGCNRYGTGGTGGATGGAGSAGRSYGSGGGGGSGNAAGGDGAPGFVRIYCFSATTI